MQVKGIGQWTVDMFLIFHLGRPDVLPVGDLGVRRAAMIEYRLRKLPEPRAPDAAGPPVAPLALGRPPGTSGRRCASCPRRHRPAESSHAPVRRAVASPRKGGGLGASNPRCHEDTSRHLTHRPTAPPEPALEAGAAADSQGHDAVQLHPRSLRGVLALAEGRGPLHRGPPRGGGVPDGRGARAARGHVQLDGRAVLAGARLRRLPGASGGGARRVQAPQPCARGASAGDGLGVGAADARQQRVRDRARDRPREPRRERAPGRRWTTSRRSRA